MGKARWLMGTGKWLWGFIKGSGAVLLSTAAVGGVAVVADDMAGKPVQSWIKKKGTEAGQAAMEIKELIEARGVALDQEFNGRLALVKWASIGAAICNALGFEKGEEWCKNYIDTQHAYIASEKAKLADGTHPSLTDDERALIQEYNDQYPAPENTITTSESEIAQEVNEDPTLIHRSLVSFDGLKDGVGNSIGSIIGLPHTLGEMVGIDMPEAMSAKTISGVINKTTDFMWYNLSPHSAIARVFNFAKGGDFTEVYDVKQQDELDKGLYKGTSIAGEAVADCTIGGVATLKIASKFTKMGGLGKASVNLAGQEMGAKVSQISRQARNLPEPVFAP